MGALVRGELVKLRTTRTALGFAVAAVLIVLATVLIVILAGEPRTVAQKRAAIGFGGPVSFVLLLFGVVGATGEYRHRTLSPALLVSPDRARLTLARLIAYALCAALAGVVMLLVAFGLGSVLLRDAPGPGLGAGDYLWVGGGGILATVLFAVIGVGVGVLVANQVAAVVGALVWFFILEPLVLLVNEDLVKFTIGQASAGVAGETLGDVLPFGLALLVLVGWAATMTLAGLLVDRRRDVA